MRGGLKGVEHDVLLVGRVLTNNDDSTGRLSLVCRDLTCDPGQITDPDATYSAQSRLHVRVCRLQARMPETGSPAQSLRVARKALCRGASTRLRRTHATEGCVTSVKIFDKSAYAGSQPWLDVTGAPLAQGDYSKRQQRWTGYAFANLAAPKNDEPWRTLGQARLRIRCGVH